MTWQFQELIGPGLGPLRGLMESGTALGGSLENLPPNFLSQADNIALTSEGRLRKRPGRHTLSGFGSRTTPRWIGSLGTTLYDADANHLRQATTTVHSGLNAGLLQSAQYTDSAANSWLLVCDGSATVKKISGTTASNLTDFPAATPSCVAVAGRRVFFSQANTLFWSTFSPTLTTSGEWPSNNELSIADPGLSAIRALVEFGGLLFAFGSTAVAQVDPRDPEAQNTIALSGFGISGPRAVCAGKDRLFFTDGNDVFAWAPGGLPQSIAALGDGRSLVRGLMLEAASTDPFTVLGFDGFRDLLFVSNTSTTLVFSFTTQAWTRWSFGASCWAFVDSTMHLCQSSLTESLALDWTKHQDTLAGSASPFTWTIRTASMRAGGDHQVRWKKLRFGFPGDTALSEGSATVTILKNGIASLAAGEVALELSGVFSLDSSLLGDEEGLGGSGAALYQDLYLPYPQGELLATQLSANNNQPFQLHSLQAEAQTGLRL